MHVKGANPKRKLVRAYRRLFTDEKELFLVDANERSITHKFAEYIQIEFPDYNVDCEYNRTGLEIKKLFSLSLNKKIKIDDTNGDTVYPDIIVHRRSKPDNFIVIEAKKSNNATGSARDKKKLRLYKVELGYKYAYRVTFRVSDISASFLDFESMIEEIF